MKIAQINTADESAGYRLVAGATLELAFTGTDTIDKLFLDGIQQPAGVYESAGNPGSGIETPLISGTGTLTVTSGPSGYSVWALKNAPGEPFNGDHDGDSVQNGIEYFLGESGSSITRLPTPGPTGTINFPINHSYTGTYGTHYHLETSPNLEEWNPVLVRDVTITPGTHLTHILPPAQSARFVRIAVQPE